MDSVQQLSSRLATARRVVVVGNGGIALELVHEVSLYITLYMCVLIKSQLTFCDVHWVVRDAYVGSAFFDAAASAFIMPSLQQRATSSSSSSQPNSVPATSSSIEPTKDNTSTYGGYGLGPEWVTKSGFGTQHKASDRYDLDGRGSGTLKVGLNRCSHCSLMITFLLQIHYNQEVQAVSEDGGLSWQQVLDDSTTTVLDAKIIEGERDYPLHIFTTTGEVSAMLTSLETE